VLATIFSTIALLTRTGDNTELKRLVRVRIRFR
jgi:hypothetical protein